MANDTTNKDGLPMSKGRVGLAAGMSEDGRTSVHDKHMPDTVQAKYKGGPKRPFNLLESRDYHERIEDAEIQAGKEYYEAHRTATEAEHARMRQMGFDPNEVEALQQPYIDAAAHEARARGDTKGVGNEPYRGAGEPSMRSDGDGSDNRFILDRAGNRYESPKHGKLLGQTEIVTAKRSDRQKYGVLDPNSGMVFAEGETRMGALRKAQKKALDLGRPRLKDKFDKEPPLSQQQLREKFKDKHPDARIAMPLKPGADAVGENIKELHKGKTHARTEAKFGAAKANKQSIAIALSKARESKGKRHALSFGSS